MNDSNSETMEYPVGTQALAEEVYAKPYVSNAKLVVDSVEGTAYGDEIRYEALKLIEPVSMSPSSLKMVSLPMF